MKASKFLLFLILIASLFHTKGIAQTSHPKPIVTAKSITPSSKKSVATPVKKTVSTPAKKTVSTPVKKSVSVPSKTAKIEFETLFFDLGTIKEDAVIEKVFEFTNVGERDLVIINATGSCGCTVPTTTPEPVPPGGKGKIMVKYTAKNKVGPQKPVVTVTTNGVPSMIKLNMEVWVDQIPGGVKD